MQCHIRATYSWDCCRDGHIKERCCKAHRNGIERLPEQGEGSEKGLSAMVIQAYEQGGGRSKVT